VFTTIASSSFVDLLLLVNGVPRGQLLVVGSRVEQLVHLASCVQLLVVGPRVGQLVLRNVPRGQLLVIGPRVGLISHLEQLVANVPRGQLLVVSSRVEQFVRLPLRATR